MLPSTSSISMSDDRCGQRTRQLTAQNGASPPPAASRHCTGHHRVYRGNDPEKSQALPYIKAKDQVTFPNTPATPTTSGVRMTGAEVVEVDSAEELRAKLSERTAMNYILSGPAAENGPLSIPISALSRRRRVFPSSSMPLPKSLRSQHPHSNTAHAVGYSGGKCMRGPAVLRHAHRPERSLPRRLLRQLHTTTTAGLQVQQRRGHGPARRRAPVVQARPRAEQREWLSWLQHIESRVKGLPSVTTEYLQPRRLSNRSPRLRIHWDANALKITAPSSMHVSTPVRHAFSSTAAPAFAHQHGQYPHHHALHDGPRRRPHHRRRHLRGPHQARSLRRSSHPHGSSSTGSGQWSVAHPVFSRHRRAALHPRAERQRPHRRSAGRALKAILKV